MQEETGMSAIPDRKLKQLVKVVSVAEAEKILAFVDCSSVDPDRRLVLEPDPSREHRTSVTSSTPHAL